MFANVLPEGYAAYNLGVRAMVFNIRAQSQSCLRAHGSRHDNAIRGQDEAALQTQPRADVCAHRRVVDVDVATGLEKYTWSPKEQKLKYLPCLLRPFGDEELCNRFHVGDAQPRGPVALVLLLRRDAVHETRQPTRPLSHALQLARVCTTRRDLRWHGGRNDQLRESRGYAQL